MGHILTVCAFFFLLRSVPMSERNERNQGKRYNEEEMRM